MSSKIAAVIGATALATIAFNLSTVASASESGLFDPYHYFSFNPYTPRPTTMPPIRVPSPRPPRLPSPYDSTDQAARDASRARGDRQHALVAISPHALPFPAGGERERAAVWARIQCQGATLWRI
jgi:hypothetical protein